MFFMSAYYTSEDLFEAYEKQMILQELTAVLLSVCASEGDGGGQKTSKEEFLYKQIICSNLRAFLLSNSPNACLHTHPFIWGYPHGFSVIKRLISPLEL